MESLRSDGSATYLLIIWVEKIIPLAMKSKQKPYPSIVFLSIVQLVFFSFAPEIVLFGTQGSPSSGSLLNL